MLGDAQGFPLLHDFQEFQDASGGASSWDDFVYGIGHRLSEVRQLSGPGRSENRPGVWRRRSVHDHSGRSRSTW